MWEETTPEIITVQQRVRNSSTNAPRVVVGLTVLVPSTVLASQFARWWCGPSRDLVTAKGSFHFRVSMRHTRHGVHQTTESILSGFFVVLVRYLVAQLVVDGLCIGSDKQAEEKERREEEVLARRLCVCCVCCVVLCVLCVCVCVCCVVCVLCIVCLSIASVHCGYDWILW